MIYLNGVNGLRVIFLTALAVTPKAELTTVYYIADWRSSVWQNKAKQPYDSFDYFNYDAAADRLALKEQSWDRQKRLIIFDELHKMNRRN